MANSVIQRYRELLTERGLRDDRPDQVITRQFAEEALARGDRQIFEDFPDFAREYGEIRDVNAPSLASEFGRSALRSTYGTGATGLGALALVTGSDTVKRGADYLEGLASDPDLAPTIQTMDDIAPGESGLGAIFDADTIRYGISKLGEAAPSMVEAIGTGLAGAAIGSAAAPGAGTIAGGAAGIVGRGAIRQAIRSLLREGGEDVAGNLVRRGLIREATQEGIETAIREGSEEVINLVARQARQLGARTGGTVASGLNSYLLSSGEIYNETNSPGISLGLGAIAAIPDTILPAIVVRRLFPDVGLNAARQSAKALVGERAAQLAQRMGLPVAGTVGEGATEWFQEGVNIVARNINEGRDPLEFTQDDFVRMREAAMVGVAGGALAGGVIAATGRGGPTVESIIPPKRRPAPIIPQPSADVSQRQQFTPQEATAPQSQTLAGMMIEISRLDTAQQKEFFTRLTQKPNRTAAEESVLDFLRSELGDVAATQAGNRAAPVTPPVIKSTTVVPNSVVVETAPPPSSNNVQTATTAPSTAVPSPAWAPPPTSQIDQAKRDMIVQAWNTPGKQIGYIVMPSPPERRQHQVDIILPGEGSAVSTNVFDLASLGINIPLPPATQPTGEYTLSQIVEAVGAPQPATAIDNILQQKIQPANPPVQIPQERPVDSAPTSPTITGASSQVSEPAQTGQALGGEVLLDSPPPQTPAQSAPSPQQSAPAASANEVFTGQAGQTPPQTQAPAPPIDGPQNEAGVIASEIEAAAQPAQSTTQPSGRLTGYASTGATEVLPAPPSTAPIAPPSAPPAVDASGQYVMPFRRSSPAYSTANRATSSGNFETAVNRLRSYGIETSLMAREYLQQSVSDAVQGHITALEQRMAQASTPAQRAEIFRDLQTWRQRAADLTDVQGVAFSPNQISIAMQDVMNASTDEFATLMHEAAEALTMALTPELRGAVSRAVESSMDKMRSRARRASESAGTTLADESSPTDLLAETLAQELTAEGVPDAPSLAQAILRWVKEIYYRVAMSIQRSMGGQPDPDTVLSWYENQLRRIVSGDFDYRFAGLFNVLARQTPAQRASMLPGLDGTPDGMADFVDPVSNQPTQPTALPESDDAIRFTLEFRRASGSIGKDLDIPAMEASARSMAAAIKYVDGVYRGWHESIAPDIPYDKFLSTVGIGKDPSAGLQSIERHSPGSSSAEIGGERMTGPMNDEAGRLARRMIQGAQRRMTIARAKAQEMADAASEQVLEDRRLLNEIEPDFRNAELQEKQLRSRLKEKLRETIADFKNGLDVAKTHGGIVKELQDTERMIEGDPLPEAYQKAFERMMGDDFPLFQYMDAIAQLDIPFADLSIREIKAEFTKNKLKNETMVVLETNKPLGTALAWLARDRAQQMDQLLVRRMGGEEFLQIQADLQEIRRATDPELRALLDAADAKNKATGIRQRIRRSYMNARQKLRVTNARIVRAGEKIDLINRLELPVKDSLGEIEQLSGGAMSEWFVHDGAVYTHKIPNDDGTWGSEEKTVRQTPDGNYRDPSDISNDIVQNDRWLRVNQHLEGQREYEKVKRQTMALKTADVKRTYQAATQLKLIRFIDKWVRPEIAAVRNVGGSGSGRSVQRLNKFANIVKSDYSRIEPISRKWTRLFLDLEKSTGIRDHGRFYSDIYDQVLYFIGANPGMEEKVAIREATRVARRRLTSNPSEDFNRLFAEFLRTSKEMSESLLGISERNGVWIEDAKLNGDLRNALSKGWITAPRSFRVDLATTVSDQMARDGWNVKLREYGKGSNRRVFAKPSTFDALNLDLFSDPSDKAAVASTLENTDLLREMLAKYFTPNTIKTFLQPFIFKPGAPLFSFRGDPIDPLAIQEAWDLSGGDVVSFIDNVGNSIGVQPDPDSEVSPVAELRSSMLHQIDSFYASLRRKVEEASQTGELWSINAVRPHTIMDARMDDMIPPEFLKFHSFDPESVKQDLGLIAFHSAFGRNGEGLKADLNDMVSFVKTKATQFRSLTATTEAGRREEAKARGFSYDEAKKASESLNEVEGLKESITTAYGLKNPASPFYDARGGYEILTTVAGQLIDNPKTGLYDLISVTMRPFVMGGINPMTVTSSVRGLGNIAYEAFGSFMENFGVKLFKSSQHAKYAREYLGGNFRKLPFSVAMADIGRDGRFQNSKSDKMLIKPLRQFRSLQRKGIRVVGIGKGGDEFSRMAMVPGLGVYSYISEIGGVANITEMVNSFETVIGGAMEYFKANPDALNDPNFRLKPHHISKNKFNAETITWIRNKASENGMGSLEDLGRLALERASREEQMLDADQVRVIAQITGQEIMGDSSMNTTPAILNTHPILRFAMPLVRWPIWMMHTAHKGLGNSDNQMTWRSVAKAMATLAMWTLPLSMAFGLVMDKYDEKVLKKKSNMPPFDPLAAIPVLGPVMAFARSDNPGDLMTAMIMRGMRAGNVYGLGADMLGQMILPLDPSTGQRTFSMDSRILALSQFLTFSQALRNFIGQDYTATWASVGRPVIQSLGGASAIHTLDFANARLGLDNAESRLVARINAQQWLRAAGQQAGVELVRGGGQSTPTPIGVWTREMATSAMANDRLGFRQSYENAIRAAREVIKDEGRMPPSEWDKEAKRRVISSWRSRDPREVFRRKPTDQEMAQMLAIMSDDGRDSVLEAIRRFEDYSGTIIEQRSPGSIRAQSNLFQVRPIRVGVPQRDAGLLGVGY